MLLFNFVICKIRGQVTLILEIRVVVEMWWSSYSSFVFLAQFYSTVRMYHCLLAYYPTGIISCLGLFMNKSGINIFVKCFCGHLLSFGKFLALEICQDGCLVTWGYIFSFSSKWLYHFIFPQTTCRVSLHFILTDTYQSF